MNNTILLIHGWGVNHYIFNNLIKNLPTYKFIAPDLPGYGNIDFNGHFNINNIADSILNEINQNDFPVHVLGWSMGGLIAIIVASKYPQKVKTITLVSSFAKYLKDETYPQGIEKDKLRDFYTLLDEDYAKYIKYFIEIQAYNKNIDQQTRNNSLQNIFKDLSHIKPKSLLESLQEVMQTDVRNDLKKIRSPALIICGKKDLVTPYAMQEYLYKNIRYSELICFDNSTHVAFLSEEKLFIDVLNNFYMKNN